MKHDAEIKVTGHVKIFDPESQQVFVDQHNAIHFENISESLAASLTGNRRYIREMHFGRGGTSINSTGVINYLPPNINTQNSSLYNYVFHKSVDTNDSDQNLDPARNKMEVRHIPATVYSDILITCLLDYGEPQGQFAFDNANTLDSQFIFDELGVRAWDLGAAPGVGKLLTHVIFHPVQKSLNRLIQIDYTIRIQSLTNLTGLY